MKTIVWMGSSKEDLIDMPGAVVEEFGYGLYLAQVGQRHVGAKPYDGSIELVENFDGDTYRCVYNVKIDDEIYVLHSFQKKSTSGIAVPKHDKETINARLKAAKLLADEKKRKGSRK